MAFFVGFNGHDLWELDTTAEDVTQNQRNLRSQVIPATVRTEVDRMMLEQVLNEISTLTPSEKLKITQMVWDKLPNDLGTDLSTA